MRDVSHVTNANSHRPYMCALAPPLCTIGLFVRKKRRKNNLHSAGQLKPLSKKKRHIQLSVLEYNTSVNSEKGHTKNLGFMLTALTFEPKKQ